jgi:hypothetical protein
MLLVLLELLQATYVRLQLSVKYENFLSALILYYPAKQGLEICQVAVLEIDPADVHKTK